MKTSYVLARSALGAFAWPPPAVATTQAALAGDQHYWAMIQGTSAQASQLAKGRVLLLCLFFVPYAFCSHSVRLRRD